MALASAKQLLGKGLGKSVTGALMARIPLESLPATAGGGRTARPLAMVQSLMVSTSLSCSRASSRVGGYEGPVREDIVQRRLSGNGSSVTRSVVGCDKGFLEIYT
jgi:hypothetical protein